ncbi:DUF1963 domain-containing protein [Micromonospora sp. WMMD812]|uniref:DUF1963 domain-containing protein n=1 Tax=Micromonospora sp. WMMD812 TaxID=3015152 RepID=UPI00248BD1B4|nr:DUF1963 domain-containing protein [Micromonospora sp. WMMD812]WBB68753.1 DUF1963 domain-containing protein [Micromonospora sp. WMMD812]
MWLQLARPVLELHTVREGPVVGYFGGKPALPEGVEWPDGMTYLVSLDLSAIPAGSHDIDLPSDGHLLFFSEPDIAPEAEVVYVPAGTPVTERELEEDAYHQECERFPLYGVRGWDFPFNREDSVIDIGESRYDEKVFSSIKWHLTADNDCVGTIGGYTDRATGGGEHGLESPETETLLGYLYVDADLGGEGFGRDGTMVGWVLANEDLAQRRFDRARTVSDFNG